MRVHTSLANTPSNGGLHHGRECGTCMTSTCSNGTWWRWLTCARAARASLISKGIATRNACAAHIISLTVMPCDCRAPLRCASGYIVSYPLQGPRKWPWPIWDKPHAETQSESASLSPDLGITFVVSTLSLMLLLLSTSVDRTKTYHVVVFERCSSAQVSVLVRLSSLLFNVYFDYYLI